VAQTITIAAASSTFNGHTIPDGYTVIYAKDGVIVAVNGVVGGVPTAATNNAIAFLDDRTDVTGLYIGRTNPNSATPSGYI